MKALSELQREALQNAMARFEMDTDAPAKPGLEQLLRSLARVQAGQYAGAAADARAALAAGRHRLRGAHLLFAAGHFGEALDELEAIDDPHARRLRTRLATALGWNLDAHRAIEEGIAAGDDSLTLRTRALDIHSGAGCTQQAIEGARALRQLEPSLLAVSVQLAWLLSRSGTVAQIQEAKTVLADMDEEATRAFGARFLLEAGRCLLWCESPDEAHAAFSRCLMTGPSDSLRAAAMAEIAHLHFVEGRDQEAKGVAQEALSMDTSLPLAWVVLGALGVVSGDVEMAGEHLLKAIACAPHDTLAQSWQAELHLREGAYEEARDALHAKRSDPDSFLFVLGVQRLLVSIRTREKDSPVTEEHRFREVRDGLLHYQSDAAEIMATSDQGQVDALLSRVLQSIGRARRIPPPLFRDRGARRRARAAILRIQSLGEDALEAFDVDLADVQGDALVRCHRGELAMWLGRYEEAEADLRGAIKADPETRWAYIGLSALELVAGNAEEALARNEEGIKAMGGTVGAAVHVHRGEALRLLGRFDEARVALDEAHALHPERISVQLNLALLAHATDDEPSFAAMFDELQRRAPGLLSDALRECEDGEPKTVVLSALRILGANRSSSCISYWATTSSQRRQPRFVPTGESPPIVDQELRRLRAHFGLHRRSEAK
jgi:tetratricopeptide (TPR) repeat protein